MAATGYSGTPLPKKLGLRDGQRVVFGHLPKAQAALETSADFKECMLADTPIGLTPDAEWDVVHWFFDWRAEMENVLPLARNAIAQNGMVWVSWPKRASKVKTDITEDVVRELALPTGLVDVKVCSVDAIWSGLKLVIRKSLRT